MSVHILNPADWASLNTTSWRVDGPDGAMDTHIVVQAVPTGVDDEEAWPTLVELRGYQPVRYAQVVIAAAARAEYEQMVMQQLTARMGIDDKVMVAHVLLDLREQVGPIPNAASTAPLTFTPIFGHNTRQGMVQVEYAGIPFSQWTPADAFGHAHAVLKLVAVADLDRAYTRYLVDKVGLDLATASTAVHFLGATEAPEAPAQPAPGDVPDGPPEGPGSMAGA